MGSATFSGLHEGDSASHFGSAQGGHPGEWGDGGWRRPASGRTAEALAGEDQNRKDLVEGRGAVELDGLPGSQL